MKNYDINVALAGNPNSGKTTIFNALTGSRQHTGNWPGVTVEKKEGGFTFKGKNIHMVDLPGTYALSSYSEDERIARDYLAVEKPDFVIVVTDSSNFERNMQLVLQLKELGQNLILVLNMIDIAVSKGIEIDADKISKILGIPVVKTVANKNEGIKELKTIILGDKKKKKSRPRYFGIRLDQIVEKMAAAIAGEGAPYPPAFVAAKILEEDPTVLSLLEKFESKADIMKLVLEAEKISNGDTPTFIAERRFGYIHGLYEECVNRRSTVQERMYISDRIDRVVTNRFFGIPFFFFLLWLTFEAVFKLGSPAADWVDTFFSWFSERIGILLASYGSPSLFVSFVQDGVIGGVGAVLVFVPIIFILFLIIAFFEDTGYMARIAFVMDKLMHILGLHGKSFIPMILGFGCNVPAIMATRTLESKKDRILTILVNPLMSCSARLPIYILFAGTFFSKIQGTIIVSLYLLGIVLAILVARIFKTMFFKGEVAPLVMELPPYHLPVFKNVLRISWARTFIFIKKAGTIIFGAVVLIWVLASLPLGVEYAGQNSLIGSIGKFFAPVFKPAGFGFYQAAVALIFGVIAKEVVVATMGTLFGTGDLAATLQNYFTPASAYAFMVMSLIYIPCVATIGAIKKEAGGKWALFATSYSLVLGWLMAVIVFQIGKLFL